MPTLGIQAADLRGAQVVFWYPAGGELQKEYAAQVTEFNQSNVWGITVAGRAFPSSNGLEEPLNAAIKSGEMPQAVLAPLELLLSWQTRDPLLIPLEPYLKDPEWGLTAQEPGDFWPVFWQDGLVGSQRWAIPAGRSVEVLFYNQTWAEQLGFRQAPVTPADFRAQACAAAKANLADAEPENNGTGGWIISDDPLSLESWRLAFGGEALPVQEGRAYQFNTPPSVSAFTYLRKLSDDRCAWTARSPLPYTYFAQRRALFYSGNLLDLPAQERAMAFEKSSDRWTVIAYPAENSKPVALTSGASYALLRSTAQRQLAAWLFMHHLMLPRVQTRLAAAGGLLPARGLALQAMDDYRNGHPAWAAVAGWKDRLQPAPRLASWRSARRVLQDAAWQIFSPATKPAGIPAILAELDTTITDILKLAP
jgi:ABC-type glycerol-3-phosphate transport system substrate-binding protein